MRGVVANAGFADRRTLAELDDDIVSRSLQTMVVSLAHLLRKSLPIDEEVEPDDMLDEPDAAVEQNAAETEGETAIEPPPEPPQSA